MKVSALAPWYGSKRTLAGEIARQLGPHRVYWEPFCGSCAVLLGKEPATMETVNDLHGDLVNLARVIRDRKASADLYRRLRRTLFCQDFLREAKKIVESTPFEPTPERAYHFFVYAWFGRNGTVGSTGGVNFCLRYTGNGGQPAKRFASVVLSVPHWHRRLREVTILSECGLKLLERIEDGPGVVIYCDPPYLSKGEKYVHDFAAADHDKLAGLVCRFKRTRVVVSYYDHPELKRLYPGWSKVAVDVNKFMAAAVPGAKGGAVKAPEVLLVNGPPAGKDDEALNLFT